MSRNTLQFAFSRMAEEVVPHWLQLKDFGGVKLHPLIRPVVTDAQGNSSGGGFDNSKTIFGLTIPAAHAKTLICQVSEATEKAIAAEANEAIAFLRIDLRTAVDMWEAKSLPHEIAANNPVKL